MSQTESHSATKSSAKTITIENASGVPLYIYNFNYGSPASANPVQNGNPLNDKGSLSFSLTPDPKMRIYVAASPLSESIEKGVAPDPFNFTNDGKVQYSFVEYDYESDNDKYTIDLSYIDEYSYPATLTFSNIGTYKGCDEGFEYGFTDFAKVTQALSNQTDSEWSNLIWPLKDVKTKWNKFPDGIHRIVGPNKVWAAETDGKNKIGPWVPESYLPFINKWPKSGTELFVTPANFKGWQNLTASDSPSPSDTGYVKALHSAATPDSNGKYGFFCYPEDNTTGEFTWVPTSVGCKVKIYPC